MSSALPSQSEPVLPKRAAHYLWAVLIARIYEVFPSCVRCVAGRCASSRSLRTALTSGTSRTTSGQIQSHPHLPGARATAVG